MEQLESDLAAVHLTPRTTEQLVNQLDPASNQANTTANPAADLVEKRTPYQGKRRSFGLFKCPNCEHQWSSGNSWANMGQECTNCTGNQYVYPFRQRRLQKGKNKDDKKRHLQEFCEKCKLIGHSCRLRVPAS